MRTQWDNLARPRHSGGSHWAGIWWWRGCFSRDEETMSLTIQQLLVRTASICLLKVSRNLLQLSHYGKKIRDLWESGGKRQRRSQRREGEKKMQAVGVWGPPPCSTWFPAQRGINKADGNQLRPRKGWVLLAAAWIWPMTLSKDPAPSATSGSFKNTASCFYPRHMWRILSLGVENHHYLKPFFLIRMWVCILK